MSASGHDRFFPRGPLAGAIAMIVVCVGLIAVSRVTGVGVAHVPAADPVAVRELRFEDRADGSVAVIEASSNQIAEVLEPGKHGFVRGVLRSFARERRASAISDVPPFRLARLADGRLMIEDTATGRRIELDAFGTTNVVAFTRLLAVNRSTQ
jgi:putative photosynthetic complex assembly protein